MSIHTGKRSSKRIDEKDYWFSPPHTPQVQHAPTAFLLSIYDEYTIAYKDRSGLSEERHIERFLSMGNALTSVIVIDGKIEGTWKRCLSKKLVDVKLSLLRKLSQVEQKALDDAIKRYKLFWASL